jgi:hypothetical protein
MLKRVGTGIVAVCAVALTYAAPVQAQQTLNFTIGQFRPLGADSRVAGDVLNENRTFLLFDHADFNGASVGGEWLFPIGQFVEAGAGISYFSRTVPSVYQDYVDSDGTEIEQDLHLRQVPIAFTVRLLPLGQFSPVQPYVGVGLGVINWRYSETGEFADFASGGAIFYDTFTASGNETAPVVLGGVRFAGDTASVGGEIRYQKAEADLDPSVFAGSKLDLGGWTYNFTIGLRF